MDPLTQGALGACVPQMFARRKELVAAGVTGWLAGMAPDLDVLISSQTDPLLSLEFHRQFTHSLLFIPVGGFLTAGLMWILFMRRWISFPRTFLYATIGYATHGLLDACTSYGTLLLWPFSNARISWDNIAVIDPLVTLPLLAAIVLAVVKKRRRWAIAGFGFMLSYLCFGVFQRERAVTEVTAIAAARGHSFSRIEVKPSIGNLILWRAIYETDERFYVDAVRMSIFGKNKFFEGASLEKLNLQTAYPELSRGSVQFKDIERFKWFSQDWIAKHPDMENVIGDARYALLPDSTKPLWGIRISPELQHEHVELEFYRKSSKSDLNKYLQFFYD